MAWHQTSTATLSDSGCTYGLARRFSGSESDGRRCASKGKPHLFGVPIARHGAQIVGQAGKVGRELADHAGLVRDRRRDFLAGRCFHRGSFCFGQVAVGLNIVQWPFDHCHATIANVDCTLFIGTLPVAHVQGQAHSSRARHAGRRQTCARESGCEPVQGEHPCPPGHGRGGAARRSGRACRDRSAPQRALAGWGRSPPPRLRTGWIGPAGNRLRGRPVQGRVLRQRDQAGRRSGTERGHAQPAKAVARRRKPASCTCW